MRCCDVPQRDDAHASSIMLSVIIHTVRASMYSYPLLRVEPRGGSPEPSRFLSRAHTRAQGAATPGVGRGSDL